MGVICNPLNKASEGFECSWWYWEFLRDALKLLGADTSHMMNLGEGQVIRGERTQDWAAQLQEAFESGRLKLDDEKASLERGEPICKLQDHAELMQKVIDFFERSAGMILWN